MSGITVLLVDDSATVRRVLCDALVNIGIRVVTAETAAAAIQEARKCRPEIVLLACQLRDLSADGVVAYLAKRPFGERCAVMLLKSRKDVFFMEELRALGVVDTMTRPVAPDIVADGVRHWAQVLTKPPEETTQSRPPMIVTDKTLTHMTQGATHIFSQSSDSLAPQATTMMHVQDTHTSPEHSAESWDGIFASHSLPPTMVLGAYPSLPPMIAGPVAAPQNILPGGYAMMASVLDIPLPEMLQLLKFQNQSGILEVRLGETTSSWPVGTVLDQVRNGPAFELGFHLGQVVSATARNGTADYLLGRYFVHAGWVKPAELSSWVSKPQRAPLGMRLVEAGIITEDQLESALQEQVQDLCFEMLKTRRGVYGFRRGEDLLPALRLRQPMLIDGLLFEALRRMDEWQIFESVVDDERRQFSRVSYPTVALKEDEKQVLDALSDTRPMSVRQIMQATSGRPFQVSQILYRLHHMRCVNRHELL